MGFKMLAINSCLIQGTSVPILVDTSEPRRLL